MVPDEWKVTEVDLATDITTISNQPCLVKGVYINVATSAHAVPIESGTTQTHVIPASAAAGNAYAFGPARYETSLIVDPDNSATGKIVVTWRELARHN